MNLENVLKYQEEDMKLIALDKELSQSEAYKKFKYLSGENSSTQEELKLSVRRVQELYQTIEQQKINIDKAFQEVEDIVGVAADFEELKEVDLYEKKIAQLQKHIEMSERDISRINKEITDCGAKAKDCFVKLHNITAAAEKVKQECESVKESQKSKRAEVIANLKSLESTLDASVLKKYNDVRKQGKTPPIVEFKDNFCAGCNMEVDRIVADKMSQGAFGECPNCGRIIYRK